MKQFKFKLESVLHIRERVVDEAQQNHAAAGRRLEGILSELNEGEAEHKSLAKQLEEMQLSTFRPAEREMLWNALKYQKDHCARLQQKADFAVKDLQEKREKLLEAQSEHEAMVKLQDKEQLEHARVSEKEERAMIDDVVNSRHAAKKNPGGAEAK